MKLIKFFAGFGLIIIQFSVLLSLIYFNDKYKSELCILGAFLVGFINCLVLDWWNQVWQKYKQS